MLSFLREIDKAMPQHLDVHCIVDNYASHSIRSARPVRAAASPAHALRANLPQLAQSGRAVFRNLTTGKAIRRGSLTSVKDLTKMIDSFVRPYNENCNRSPGRLQPIRGSYLGVADLADVGT